MLLACLLIAACGNSNLYSSSVTNAPQQLTPSSSATIFCFPADNNNEYRLGLQDQIKVTVQEEKTLSGDFTIDNNGMITMPLIGDIGVGGCTVGQTKQILTDRYADGYLIDPKISVEIQSYSPIYIIGEVRAPGKFDYTPDMNVLKAVALAGGFTYRADKKTVQILRKNKNGDSNQGNAPIDVEIIPGDIITIKERFF